MKHIALLALLGGLVTGLIIACAPALPTTLNIKTSDFTFDPTTWTIPVGQKITVNLRNDAAQEHEWVIMKQGTQATVPFGEDDEPNVLWETEVQASATKTDSFTVTEPGTYQIVCGLAGHLEQGMLGTLIVK